MRTSLEDAYEMYQLAQNLELETAPYYKAWKQLEAPYEAYKKERARRLGTRRK